MRTHSLIDVTLSPSLKLYRNLQRSTEIYRNPEAYQKPVLLSRMFSNRIRFRIRVQKKNPKKTSTKTNDCLNVVESIRFTFPSSKRKCPRVFFSHWTGLRGSLLQVSSKNPVHLFFVFGITLWSVMCFEASHWIAANQFNWSKFNSMRTLFKRFSVKALTEWPRRYGQAAVELRSSSGRAAF